MYMYIYSNSELIAGVIHIDKFVDSILLIEITK